jgi:N-acetylmuramoyl-L-alanine amidase
VDAALGSALDLPRHGVRAAPLEVLQGAAMPGVVVELGFLTSPDDVAKLGASDFGARLAAALGSALREFKQDARTMAAAGRPPADNPPESRPQLPPVGSPSGGEDHD